MVSIWKEINWTISNLPFFSVWLDRKKVHYTFDDHSEMVEEYDAKTNLLLSRKLLFEEKQFQSLLISSKMETKAS